MLAASGFQMKLADTNEKMPHLKTLPQRKLVPHQKGDEVYYADAMYCKCIYAGPYKAYERYQQMAVTDHTDAWLSKFSEQQVSAPIRKFLR